MKLNSFSGMNLFDVSVFNAELATTLCLIRGETVEEEAQSLVKPGKTRMTGGMFRFLGNVIYNNSELLRARDVERDNRANVRQDKEDE